MTTTRRQALQSALAAAGGLAAGTLLPARAKAQTTADAPTVVIIWLQGGYNCIFSSADSCVAEGPWGVTAGNVKDLGNGVVVDASTMGTLPLDVTRHFTTVGVHHGYSDHVNGVNIWWNRDGYAESMPLKLAQALGGNSAFRCVSFFNTPGVHRATGGVSQSIIPDLSSALLTAGAAVDLGPTIPDRHLMGLGLGRSLALSRKSFLRSPTMLREAWEGMHTAQSALLSPPRPVDWSDIASAYGIGSSLTINSFASQMAAAELMLRTGTDVVTVVDRGEGSLVGFGWDSHGDMDGNSVRTMMRARMTALSTFLSRTLAIPGRNVVTAIIGEFARSVHDSGHAGGISATVVGKRLTTGTTGRAIIQGPNYKLAEGTPGIDGFYALLCEAAGVPSTFGTNPHTSLLA